jgi:UDP-N-acetylglucosamine transferase subunit ALG13
VIVVTVGSSAGFDSLMRKMDELACGALRDHEIIAQIATGRYEPQHMQWFRYSEQLPEMLARADLIIGHGGTGTTIEALKLGKPFVGLANRILADDHQHEFLVEFERRGLLTYCTDLDQLQACVEAALRRPSMTVDTGRFGRLLAEAIEADFAPSSPGGVTD